MSHPNKYPDSRLSEQTTSIDKFRLIVQGLSFVSLKVLIGNNMYLPAMLLLEIRLSHSDIGQKSHRMDEVHTTKS